ncbi:hypothetical protein [Thalassomonas actiniarum]|uniref:Uncharacterized protein n=1 Tax=Thalassomonas actiniarum TaxID=485447 RepID=A0AAE9YW51_9GAMM|nr:hypothetical protein [Thalassomonas actiniarum]WDE01460.1 hypothetical protein SG35_013080 [Thalassomonas actiniarum]
MLAFIARDIAKFVYCYPAYAGGEKVIKTAAIDFITPEEENNIFTKQRFIW